MRQILVKRKKEREKNNIFDSQKACHHVEELEDIDSLVKFIETPGRHSSHENKKPDPNIFNQDPLIRFQHFECHSHHVCEEKSPNLLDLDELIGTHQQFEMPTCRCLEFLDENIRDLKCEASVLQCEHESCLYSWYE